MQGTVKFYNNKKGFGFIVREDAEGDIFFHNSNFHINDHGLPEEMDKVEFEIQEQPDGRTRAVDVRIILRREL